MNTRLFRFAGGVTLSLVAAAGATYAQDTQTTTTTTTQTTKTIQNADGTYSVIQYPANKEVIVNLTPTTVIPGASGKARILRNGTSTAVNLDLTGLTGDATGYNLYAVDPAGKVTSLGPITVNDGVGTLSTTTPLDKFMLVLSPDANLTSIAPDTKVVLRSAVPEGFAVVPVAQNGPEDGAPVGGRVKATTTPGGTSAYNAPLLGIPNFRRGTDTHLKVNFTGPMQGTRANIFLEPRKDGPTEIKLRFHDLKRAPANSRLVLWAVAPDNTYTKIGQVINTGGRNETEIKGETALKDFGLFVTAESAEVASPTTPIIGTIIQRR
ncbi:MAG: hypothetical protein ABR577_11000 [Pyrinomonadaceae bacterium]